MIYTYIERGERERKSERDSEGEGKGTVKCNSLHYVICSVLLVFSFIWYID